MMLIVLKVVWQIVFCSPMVWAVSFWAHATMPLVATTSTVIVLLQVGSHPAQLLFYAAQEKMTAQNPPATIRGRGKILLPLENIIPTN